MSDNLINRINSLPDELASYSNSIDAIMLNIKELKSNEEIDKVMRKIEEHLKHFDELITLLEKDTSIKR